MQAPGLHADADLSHAVKLQALMAASAVADLTQSPSSLDPQVLAESPHPPPAQPHSSLRRSSSGGGTCVLPYITTSGLVRSSEGLPPPPPPSARPGNDFLPPDLVLCLRQQGGIPESPPRGGARLPPPKGLQQKSPRVGGASSMPRPPPNMWNYPGRRGRLRHLTDHPPCICGAGRLGPPP